MVSAYKSEGLFPDFPFGSAFEDVELPIAFALKTLKTKAAGPEAAKIPGILKELPTEIPNNLTPFFERMGLFKPITPEEIGSHKTLMLAFKLSGFF